jgi:hypothetical protein
VLCGPPGTIKTQADFLQNEFGGRMERLKRIIIGETDYPYKIDLNVLERIQEEYGSVHEFERDLLGMEYSKDEAGNQLYDEDGEPLMYKKEPSIKAIRTVLPLMINEGMEIEAEEKGGIFTPAADQVILRECGVPFNLLAEIIHEEFRRCFATKK